jgi:hypothetical protein
MSAASLITADRRRCFLEGGHSRPNPIRDDTLTPSSRPGRLGNINPIPRRHARHRALQTGFQDGFSFAPRYRFSAATDQRSPVRLLVLPVRSRSLVTAFHSLGMTVRSPNHHPEVIAPGLLLRNPAELSSGPLTLCSPLAAASTPPQAAQRADPLPESHPVLPVSLRAYAPRRGVTPRWINALTRFGPGQAHLPNPPDFPSLPATGSCESARHGSTFQVRYVSVGLLFPDGRLFPGTTSRPNQSSKV